MAETLTDWDDEEVTGVTRAARNAYKKAIDDFDSDIEELLRRVT